MAVELASATMTPLIEKLGNLLASELTLEKRVRQDVASLHKEMEEMHLALQRVEVPPEQLDQGTAEWASNVRELSYDMEDAVDAFILHLGENDDHAAATVGLRSRFRGFLDKTVRLFSKGKSLHLVAAAVREAKRLTTELDEIHQRYAGVGASSIIDDLDPRLKAMSTEAADLVGVDGARDEVIKILSSDESEVDVQTVSIVGFGGLGKTTLARAVFDKIKLQFNCSAFVSVSKNPDITRIFKKILYQLDGEKFSDINEAVRDYDQLVHDLKEFLHNKRYLIVIDDLWDVKSWEFIKCAFPRNTCSSRLITTSRKRNVSEATFSFDAGKIHEMKPLSDTDSLRLFHSRIFHPVDGCPPELEQVSRDILKKCGGVPLAIISVASLLANRKQVKTKDQWLILLNSIGRGLKELPATITGLRKLMCLRLDWDTRLPNGLGNNNLTSLEELTGLRIGGHDDSAAMVTTELGHLTGLRVLTLRWERPANSIDEALVQSLGNLRKLQSLDMYVNGGRGGLIMRDWAPPPRLRRFLCKGPTSALPTLPAWIMKNTTSLAFLDMWVGQVGPDDLRALGALPSLRGVRLRSRGRVDDDDRHRPSALTAGAFPCARACAFLHFTTAPSMFLQGAMPHVQRLEFTVRACDFGASARGGFGLDDLRMGHLTSLEEVHVELWSRKEDDAAVVAAALRQAAEDHPNRLAIRINQRSGGRMYLSFTTHTNL
ncbi:hypothetical protein PR202_gb27005 [Eleusine coracana subsp. coracana]|uniref:Uncharacterized protein n=1 Tax=Eleusine coracana subsp. coracana TaxID=191504 RepID=A0AAV5FT07_ELECO|nr:hypothetical protein PR202_gb27005 [Eleusine coracana subsp. coracana]